MCGLELEPNLVKLGASLFAKRPTEPAYRLYSVNDIHPDGTSMALNATNGVPAAVERWSVPADGVATLLSKSSPARPFNRED